MRRFFVALLLCLCSLAMYGQKTRFGQEAPYAKPGVDYPIKVHISGLHYRGEYKGSGLNEAVIYADTVMDGKKLELRGDSEQLPFQAYNLSPGDYQARLLKDPHKVSDTPMFQEYEVVLPNKKVWRCTVSGVYE